MYADRIRVACYGDKKIPSKLKYFFKEDLYELSDVKLDERINLLRIHLKYVFYDNPLSEYFKNEGNLLSEKSLICIYFLCLNNLEEYRNEKEYILNRYKDSGNEENDECIIIYAYNLEDNINEIKNIKKIKSDFSHNSYKSIKILSLPILKNEDYDDSNNKMKELYEHFKIRYMDHLKICIEKKYHLIRSGYTKSMTNFLNFVDHSKKSLGGEKKKKNSQKRKFHLTDFMYQVGSGQEENQILQFVNFYKKHNVFLFCNEFVDINFFLKKNDLFSYMNEIEFVTDYDEELYIELYDHFLVLFIWCENLCLLFCKLNLFKKSYVLYSTMAKLFIKHLNVFVKKKKCFIHSSILFEKNYLTLARYIRERNICSMHLLEYVFFKKFSLLLFLNKFSYISSKALRFAQFFYTNKIFIFMHNFSRFKNSVIRNSTQISYLKNIQRKVTKYRRRDLLVRAAAKVPPPGEAQQGENQRGAQRDLVEEDNPKSDHNGSLEHAQRDATPRRHSLIPDKNLGKHKKSLISEFKEVFRKGVGNVDSAARAGGRDDAVGEHMGQGMLGPDEDHLQDNCLKEDYLKEDYLKEDYLKEDYLKEDYLKEDYLKEDSLKKDYLKEDNLQDDGLLDDVKLLSDSPAKTASNDLSTRPGHSSRGDHLGEFPDERDKITFLLKCCFMNKESYFAVYFYNLANLIKFLFERRSSFYQEEQKKNKSDKSVKKNNTNISKYLSLQKNIMKLGYKKNFSKKKKSKKSLKIKTKRSNSLNDSSTSQLSSTLSEPSDGRNNNYSFYQHNDFYINVSNIFKLSFVILKNIINSYKTDKLFDERNAKKVYLLNFFLHYLEEKQFEKNIQKEDMQQVKNGKKNVYHTFPIYHIKFFSKNNEKEKNNLLISIMNKITNLCYRKYGNIAMINKFFLAIILFENSKFSKSLKILKKIIQKCNHDFVIFFCMQLISLHKVNNQFYHFCSSFFLSNKYTPISSFKDVNINFAKIDHYQDYLFFRHTKNSLLQIEHDKCYGSDFFSSLGKNIFVSYRNVMHHVLKSVARNGEMHLSTVHTQTLPHGRGTIQRGLSKDGEQIGGYSQKDTCRGTTTPTNVNKNKVIQFERKVFYQNNYYFEPNAGFLKSLRRFNFSVSKNDEKGDMHIPHSDVKVFVQSNYNLYLFASNMLFGKFGEADEAGEGDPTPLPHIGTLLRLKIQKYTQKQGKGTGKAHLPRVKQLCVQYDENIDLFVFSALSQNLLIHNVMIELYDERANKKLHLNFEKNKFVIKTGLNLIKLNISRILECSQIKWKNFYYKINYVFLQVNHFCFYQQLGILPNGNILTPFLNVYTKFIKSNYILSEGNKYASFFLDQLVSPLYIKIKTLQSDLDCQLVASYLNNTSLVCNSTNYVKLIVSNCHRHVDSREENEFISTQRKATKGGPHMDIPTTSNSNQIKNVHLFVHNKGQDSDFQHMSEKCTLPDSVFFIIEANDHIQISEPKVLKGEDTCFTKFGDTSKCPVEKEQGDYHDICDYGHRGERKKDSYAVISFVPVRSNNPNMVNSEQSELNFNSEKNLHSCDSPDGHSSSHDSHSRNSSDKVKIKCVINIDLGKKKRRQRKTDLYELSNVNYVGQTQFDNFINLEKGPSCYPPLNNQIVLDKTFHLANIFNEKIKTYRSKNTMLYELILKLHKDNYSVFLKKFHVSIRKKCDTDITGARIFLLNGHNGGLVRSHSLGTGDNSSNDMAQLQAYTLGAQQEVEEVKQAREAVEDDVMGVKESAKGSVKGSAKGTVESDLMDVKGSVKGSEKDDVRKDTTNHGMNDATNRGTKDATDLGTTCAIVEGEKDAPPPGADTPNESDESNVNLWSANHMQESGASSLSLLSANDLNEEGGGKRNPSNEVSYFYDEIDINSYIHGGMSVFFLFEVTYGDAQQSTVHDDGTNGPNDGTNECDNVHNGRDDSNNGRDDDRNATNPLIHESMTGTLCVTYEYRSLLVIKPFERSPKEYIYTLDVPIPPFLLPINVHYEIPKFGTVHTSLNVKIVLSNNMREDIYMKYFVYQEERKKNDQSEGDDEYNWLINGFKKKVLFLPKNSSHVINLIILPLKIGLINFPPILYYVKLNNRWVEVTEVLKKSENFQLIISPSLHFSPKVWQLA